MSKVDVSLTGTATTVRYASMTGDRGQDVVPNLPVGNYRIPYLKTGFKTAVLEPVSLRVAEVVRVDVRMEVGVLAESIDVSGEAPRLQTDVPDAWESRINGTAAFSKAIVLDGADATIYIGGQLANPALAGGL